MADNIIGPLFDSQARIISLLGRIESLHVDMIVDQLLRFDAQSDESITVFISSQGGNMIEGLKLVDCIGLLRSPLTAAGFGLIEGAGILLLAMAHHRILFPSTLISTAGLWDLPYLHQEARVGMGLHQQTSVTSQLDGLLVKRVHEAVRKSGHCIETGFLETNSSPQIYAAPECVTLGLADAVIEGPHRLLQKAEHKEYRNGKVQVSR